MSIFLVICTKKKHNVTNGKELILLSTLCTGIYDHSLLVKVISSAHSWAMQLYHLILSCPALAFRFVYVFFLGCISSVDSCSYECFGLSPRSFELREDLL